jgi:G6PDH family F420-dependent oxidoreductase
MVEIGYKLFTEAHSASKLVNYARLAEDAGFSFLSISDHYHPWISNHGHAGFAWCTIGGISQSTSRVKVSTGVTCPLMRYHPAIVAQAAATAATMMPGRFELGLGTGESLSEHIIRARTARHAPGSGDHHPGTLEGRHAGLLRHLLHP